ncbi:MAG: GNAT family N-acetyltransferase [Prevotellaceae bacterium]|jgi:predicted GNAT family N-acyltransferase|nr:GNAT family N-acetyltransferase [Prevotellaceae bacterium]
MKVKLRDFECTFVRLTYETEIKPFDCGDNDLNDFLNKDAKNYLKTLLAVTYLIETDTETIAYFSLSNDRITRYDVGKSEWNKLNRSISNEKRKRSYPAVKVGRLAVDKKYAQMGFGKFILVYVKKTYAEQLQQAGCRFVTIDAYAGVTDFYERNDFKFLTEDDKDKPTRAMYFDLKY